MAFQPPAPKSYALGHWTLPQRRHSSLARLVNQWSTRIWSAPLESIELCLRGAIPMGIPNGFRRLQPKIAVQTSTTESDALGQWTVPQRKKCFTSTPLQLAVH